MEEIMNNEVMETATEVVVSNSGKVWKLAAGVGAVGAVAAVCVLGYKALKNRKKRKNYDPVEAEFDEVVEESEE